MGKAPGRFHSDLAAARLGVGVEGGEVACVRTRVSVTHWETLFPRTFVGRCPACASRGGPSGCDGAGVTLEG